MSIRELSPENSIGRYVPPIDLETYSNGYYDK